MGLANDTLARFNPLGGEKAVVAADIRTSVLGIWNVRMDVVYGWLLLS